ncbi:Translation initiation factor, beta propellor-like domain [Dillenia turbinata]|uniref:Eukaryotic translation initiation factor 2A n=1 Tax=Dillenia turbinata TaxID=194707 RepID=A0AAN8YVP0_9MAGN
MAAAGPSPSLEILVREPEGFSLWTGPPFSNGQPSVKLERVSCSKTRFSENGSRLMVMKSNSSISIYECSSYKEIRSFEIPNVAAAILSPHGTYLQTFQKSSTPQEKNLILWNVETGVSEYQLFQKNMAKSTWPSIRFSSDESVACRMATNEIQIFEPKDFSKGIVNRLRIPGLAAMELSPPGSHVAAFIPESKGIPASVHIFACAKDSQSQPLARRSFFRCSTVQLAWNSESTGVLVVVQSDVDKSNQSYYGESKLNYLTTDGTHEGLVKKDPYMIFSGRIQVQNLQLFMDICLRKQQFSTKIANLYLSLEQVLIILFDGIRKGGFGNLPGDMAFWDSKDKKQIGTTKAEWSVTSEWSPDGRYFMTATTAPRLQVDNGIKIFHHNGSLYYKKMFDKLYQADWRPESPDKFGDLADLVKSVESLKVEDKTQGQSSKSSQTSVKIIPANPPTQKPAAYRPPHAKTAASVQAELFGGSPSEEMSKNALRNKKKREKQREKKAAEAAAAANGAQP